MAHIEALYGRCDRYLGRLFDNGPEPTDEGFCINCISVDFNTESKQQEKNNFNLHLDYPKCIWAKKIKNNSLEDRGYCCPEAIYENLNGVKLVVFSFTVVKL